ncbi:MAG TPA: LysE/ArgO family amino acid transporter [Microlunatus sp.]|nr:LysE/ArgO family amino acid transporter [Microlunatus sp.]
MITLLAGLGFGFGLIVAIGAQNAYVLRQGIRREHVGLVVAVCAVSDVLLITVGAAGVGGLIARHTTALAVVTVLGAGVLLVYAAQAVRRAVRPAALSVTHPSGGEQARLGSVLLAALALTWLNPHVYLDTVVLLGSVSATYAAPWLFALGASVASLGWFTALGFGARLLAPVFARPGAWRIFDVAVAVVMTSIAVKLLAGLA